MRGIIYAGGGWQLDALESDERRGAAAGRLPSVHDKPLIYHPLSTLMLAGIRDILLVAPPEHIDLYLDVLDDGGAGASICSTPKRRSRKASFRHWRPAAILAGEPVALICGDNLFFGSGLVDCLVQATHLVEGARILAYRVYDPKRIEVIELYKDGRPHSVSNARRAWFRNGRSPGSIFDGRASEIAGTLNPRPGGGGNGRSYRLVSRSREAHRRATGAGFRLVAARSADQGTEAARFVESLETQHDLKVACLEEIALGQGFIDLPQFDRLAGTCTGERLWNLSEVPWRRNLPPGAAIPADGSRNTFHSSMPGRARKNRPAPAPRPAPHHNRASPYASPRRRTASARRRCRRRWQAQRGRSAPYRRHRHRQAEQNQEERRRKAHDQAMRRSFAACFSGDAIAHFLQQIILLGMGRCEQADLAERAEAGRGSRGGGLRDWSMKRQ